MHRRNQAAASAAEFTRLAEERLQRQPAEPLSSGEQAQSVSESTQMGRATKDAFAEGALRKVRVGAGGEAHPRA